MAADGRSHWNMSGLMQPAEDVLDLAVTKCVRKMATAGPGQRVRLSCYMSTGRTNDRTSETDDAAQPCSTDEKQTLIKPVCTYSVC